MVTIYHLDKNYERRWLYSKTFVCAKTWSNCKTEEIKRKRKNSISNKEADINNESEMEIFETKDILETNVPNKSRNKLFFSKEDFIIVINETLKLHKKIFL